jgi:DNA mismatch repair protein MutL
MIADMFASMACHSVVRAGQVLGIEEMQSLLSQMDEFGLSSFCPHGRPVFVEYPFRELEKDFGRIV